MADVAPPLPFVETETMVLGSCLEYDGMTSQFVSEGLRDRHFYSEHHQVDPRRLIEAEREGLGASYPTVRMLLANYGELEEVRGSYLLSLTDGIPRVRSADTVRGLARRLIECSVGRDTLALLQKSGKPSRAATQALLTDGFFSKVDASLQSLSAQLAGRRIPDHVSHIGDVMAEVRAKLESGPPTFVDTPYPALNSMLGGVHRAGRAGLPRCAAWPRQDRDGARDR